MAATYTLDVVTPERIMLSEQVTQTIAPGSEGQLGILANHAPLMTELAPGEVRRRWPMAARRRTSSSPAAFWKSRPAKAGGRRSWPTARSGPTRLMSRGPKPTLPPPGRCWPTPKPARPSRRKRSGPSPMPKPASASRAAVSDISERQIFAETNHLTMIRADDDLCWREGDTPFGT